MANMRTIFSDLPPELRNEVFTYLSTPDIDSAPTNAGLPLQLRTFECKHTTIQICPVHYGSTSLLALQTYRFQEACEYRSWLFDNAISLQIGVIFKGRVNTFVLADWTKKVETHLRKLAKQHPWLNKVAKYDIHILWDATDGVLKSKKKGRTAGQIPREMAKTLTLLMDQDVKRRRSDVTVRLLLEHQVAVENALSSTKFALDDFLSMADVDGFRNLTKEVYKRPSVEPTQPLVRTPLVRVQHVAHKEKSLLEARQGAVHWTEWTQGRLVVKNTASVGYPLHVSVGDFVHEDLSDYVLKELVEECLGRR
jgi:hypothetical protein